MSGKPYSLHKRGKIYYCQFRRADGSFTTPKTTKQTKEKLADAWAISFLTDGNHFVLPSENFAEFSHNFFAYDSEWAIDRKIKGIRLSPRHCDERLRLLYNHVLPMLGKFNLSDIDRLKIKTLRNSLFEKGYAGNTINK